MLKQGKSHVRDPEYDRFGPWIIEISDADPPPPLFRPYLTDDEESLLSIKVPRRIERRNARPGMDLYDYVVTLSADRIVILQRVETGIGTEVRSDKCSYRDVQCIEYVEDLLDGRLRLFMPGRRVELPFNTVSSEIMQHVVELIRRRYIVDSHPRSVAPNLDVAEESLSFYFAGLLRNLTTRHPELHVLASQPETPIGRHEVTALRRLFFGVIGKKLLESLHLSDGVELQIVNRGRVYRYRGQAIYAKHVFHVPLSRIAAARVELDGRDPMIVKLNLETASGSFSFAFMKDNPWLPDYARVLAEAGGH